MIDDRMATGSVGKVRGKAGSKADERRLHPVAAATEESARRSGPGREGFILTGGSSNMRARFSKGMAARAIALLDLLFKEIEVRGGKVVRGTERDGGARVEFDGHSLELRLLEPARQILHVRTAEEAKAEASGRYVYAPKYDLLPTGNLTFFLEGVWGVQAKWREGKRGRHEQKFKALVDGIEAAVRKSKADNDRRRAASAREDEERRKRY